LGTVSLCDVTQGMKAALQDRVERTGGGTSWRILCGQRQWAFGGSAMTTGGGRDLGGQKRWHRELLTTSDQTHKRREPRRAGSKKKTFAWVGEVNGRRVGKRGISQGPLESQSEGEKQSLRKRPGRSAGAEARYNSTGVRSGETRESTYGVRGA